MNLENSNSYITTLSQLLRGLHKSGHWWLIPLIILMLPLSLFFILVQAVPIVAPFVYTLF
ncbi:MAG: DUF5989 family protein [Gammaproteobacteria bacterium]